MRAGAVLLAATLGLAGELRLTREGPYWVASETGTMPVKARGMLTIRGRGPITVRGGASNPLTYTLRKKVRARTESDARRVLLPVTMRPRVFREGASMLSMVYDPRADILTDVEVRSPLDLSRLSVETEGGDIQVYDIAGSVLARTGGGLLQMDRVGGDVNGRTAGGEIRFGTIGGSVKCFSGGGSITVGRVGRESWVETAGGEIFVRESAGPLHASTAGGNIRVERALATVAARTAGGRIDVHEAGGIVFAGNTGGSIQVGSAQGVRCESTGGSIRLKGASGALRAVTDVGSIFAELQAGLALQDSILTTAAGDITVLIPSNLPLTVRALNESGRAGRIVSEFMEIPVQSRPRAFRAEGLLNGGGPVLHVTSTSGTIYLRRVQR